MKYMTFVKQKNQIKYILKKPIIRSLQSIPLSSKYIGPPKGYYFSSKKYHKAYQKSDEIKITYTQFIESFFCHICHKKYPKSIHQNIPKRFKKQYLKNLDKHPETFLISAPNCRVIQSNGYVITHDDRLLLDVSNFFGTPVHKISLLNSIKLPKCQRMDNTIAILATAGGKGYFHWLLDAIPRIKIIKQCFPEGIEKIDKFVVNKGIPAITESLQMIGIPLEKIIFADFRTHIQAKNLVIPSLPGKTENPPAWVCNFLRKNLILHRANINPVPRLYISRAKATRRRIVNEEDVFDCLAEFGFTRIYLEDYNLATQISLLYNAEVIVAPHGGGLTNLVWCNSHAKVLEIFSPNYVNPCFWAIANNIGMEYFYLIGSNEKAPDHLSRENFNQEDIFVPINQLWLSLKKLLE